MAHKIKSVIKFLSKIIFVYLVLGIIYFGISLVQIVFEKFPDPGFHGRKVLLQQTNFPELLKAGRELISKAEWKEYVGEYDGQKRRDLFIPEDVNIPEAINMLRKKLSGLGGIITITNNGWLQILFSGSRDSGNFGVRIFPENFKEPERHHNYGDKILITGLWYFDDAYDEFPKLRETNEKLIKKNKYLKNK
jgi:hypothetical protein